VLLTLIDSPVEALIIAVAIILYQQLENYVFAPRITARTMELHPALAFGAALGGAAVLGAVGAILALPAAAMMQALLSNVGQRYEVIDNHLTRVPGKRTDKRDVRAPLITRPPRRDDAP
jgi:predicted PurR-regulated permease PerM